jgi:hypothetical protein
MTPIVPRTSLLHLLTPQARRQARTHARTYTHARTHARARASAITHERFLLTLSVIEATLVLEGRYSADPV